MNTIQALSTEQAVRHLVDICRRLEATGLSEDQWDIMRPVFQYHQLGKPYVRLDDTALLQLEAALERYVNDADAKLALSFYRAKRTAGIPDFQQQLTLHK